MELGFALLTIVALVAVGALVFFAVRLPRRSQQPQSPVATATVTPAESLRQRRLQEARQRRCDLEMQVAEEEALLFDEEERDFLKQELVEIRLQRRQRRQPRQPQ